MTVTINAGQNTLNVVMAPIIPETGNRLCAFYYGLAADTTFRARIKARPPEFIVIETAGGAYHRTAVTPAVIADIQSTGAKALSYVPTGNMVQFRYAADSPLNTRDYVRKCIEDIAAEGCAGIWFDEGGVGNWRYPGGVYSGSFMDMTMQAPAVDMYGQPNSWSGYTMRDWIDYAHSLGLYVITGNSTSDPRWTKQNSFPVVDQFFMRETSGQAWTPLVGMEVGNASKCSALSYGDTLATAVAYTKAALAAGFRTAYAHVDNGSLPDWYESYFDQVVPVSALIISNVVATGITQTGATISWDLSDYGTGQVEYGPTTAYGQFSTPENSFNYKHHDQVLSGLSQGTLYHFRIHSKNQAGIETVSGDYTFTTTGAPPPPSSGVFYAYFNFSHDSRIPSTGLDWRVWEYYQPKSPTDMTLVNMNGVSEAQVISDAHAAGQLCLAQVYAPWDSAGTYNTIFTNAATGDALIAQIIQKIQTYGFDGADIDWECDNVGNKTQAQVDAWIAKLRQRVDAAFPGVHKLLSCAENFEGAPPMSAAGAQNYDIVAVMVYDVAPKPDGSLADVQTAMQKYSNAGFPKKQLVAGIQFVTYNPYSVSDYRDVILPLNPSPDVNTLAGRQFTGATLAAQKTRWVLDNGYGGVFAYAIEADDFGISYPRTLSRYWAIVDQLAV